jgi:hypothetical protein
MMPGWRNTRNETSTSKAFGSHYHPTHPRSETLPLVTLLTNDQDESMCSMKMRLLISSTAVDVVTDERIRAQASLSRYGVQAKTMINPPNTRCIVDEDKTAKRALRVCPALGPPRGNTNQLPPATCRTSILKSMTLVMAHTAPEHQKNMAKQGPSLITILPHQHHESSASNLPLHSHMAGIILATVSPRSVSSPEHRHTPTAREDTDERGNLGASPLLNGRAHQCMTETPNHFRMVHSQVQFRHLRVEWPFRPFQACSSQVLRLLQYRIPASDHLWATYLRWEFL